MKAVTWQGRGRSVSRRCRIGAAADQRRVIEVTSTAICGLTCTCTGAGPFMDEGDVIGHEPMGRVVAPGPLLPD